MNDEQLELREVSAENAADACRLAVKPHQEQFVASVAESLAEAHAQPTTAWPRLVYRGDELVGFVMGAFDPDSPTWFFRSGIWRLNVAAQAQRNGVGRFAVEAVLSEARRRRFAEATVLWKPGTDGPAAFYERLGFEPTGEQFHGEVIGRLDL
jgi:diamine N-acetyltransferase